MNGSPDFIITYGLLEKYTGKSDSIVIPDGVSRIENKAFIGCRVLKEVIFPESVMTIGKYAIKVSKNTLLFFINKRFDDIPEPYRGINALLGFVTYYEEYGASDEVIKSYVDYLKAIRHDIGMIRIFDSGPLFEFAVKYSVLSADDAEGIIVMLPEDSFPEQRAELLSYIGSHSDGGGLFDILDKMLSDDFVPVQEIVKNWHFKDNDDGGVMLTKYIGNAADIITPAKIGDKTVTAIGDKTFRNCDGIKSVMISPGVKVIGELAFAWCTGLEKVIIPEGVERIEDNAFRECIRLETIKLPDSLKYIGSCAFIDCDRLCTVSVSSGLLIGGDVFSQRSGVIIKRR